jgi:hypothetical protein
MASPIGKTRERVIRDCDDKEKPPRDLGGFDFDVGSGDHGENENSSFRYVADSRVA